MSEEILISEAARRLGCSNVTVKQLEAKGLLTAYRDYRGWRYFNADEVERVRQHRVTRLRQTVKRVIDSREG